MEGASQESIAIVAVAELRAWLTQQLHIQVRDKGHQLLVRIDRLMGRQIDFALSPLQGRIDLHAAPHRKRQGRKRWKSGCMRHKVRDGDFPGPLFVFRPKLRQIFDHRIMDGQLSHFLQLHDRHACK
jgi:hypothetical protein